MPGNRKQSLQFEDVNTVIILARGEGRGRVRRGGGGLEGEAEGGGLKATFIWKFLNVLKLQEMQLNLPLPLKLETVKKASIY